MSVTHPHATFPGIAAGRSFAERHPQFAPFLTGVALLFSSFSSPALSALLTFFVFIIGHFSADLKALSVSLGSTSARWMFGALYYLLPNLANYSFITPAAHGHSPAPGYVAGVAAYAVVYITVILAGATLVFSRRNFK